MVDCTRRAHTPRIDRDYDPRGPTGPTAFWKISDKVSDGSNDHHVLMDDYEEVELQDGDYFPGESDEERSEDDGEDGSGQVEIELFIGSEVELAEILFNQ